MATYATQQEPTKTQTLPVIISNYSPNEHGSALINNTPGGIYNFTYRAMMTTDINNYNNIPNHSLNDRTVTIPGYVNIVNNNDNVYQPNTASRKTVHSNTAIEFADRYKSRPTGRPHVVGFDGRTLNESGDDSCHDPRGIHGFFPPVKLRTTPNSEQQEMPTDETLRTTTASSRISRKSTNSIRSRATTTTSSSSLHRKTKRAAKNPPPLVLELGPLSSVRNLNSARMSPGRVMSGRSDITIHSSLSHRSGHTEPVYQHLVSNNCFSSSAAKMPAKPTLVIGKDTPWVYRYKVKKSMNEINKIMGSKMGNVSNTFTISKN